MWVKKGIIIIVLLVLNYSLSAQNKPTVAVIGIDTKGIGYDNISMENLIRLELEKANTFEVLDKYDVSNILKINGIATEDCFGKSKLIEVGILLKVDKILTGNIDRFGEKIIFVLRIIDIKNKRIENTNVMEYLDLEREIQTMAKISINNLLGISNDPLLVDLLINYEHLITSPKTTVKLNGPRMGVSYIYGSGAERLKASETEGGFEMYPVTSIFGFQYERQYLSSGDFQALIEFVPALSGLESGNFIPSISLMNGFRFNKKGWEIGLGPIFRGVKYASGFYDENHKWNLADTNTNTSFPIIKQIDHRGKLELSTGLIIALGKTFHSGYLNIPLNIYFVPKKDNNTLGFIFGFNIAKRTVRHD